MSNDLKKGVPPQMKAVFHSYPEVLHFELNDKPEQDLRLIFVWKTSSEIQWIRIGMLIYLTHIDNTLVQ